MNTPPTISLAMIARDRGRELARALASVRGHVDEIVVVDAGGSTDDTQEVARSFGARVIPFLPEDHPEAFYDDVPERFAGWNLPGPWTGRKALADFSAPRNLSFAECKSDYIFWIDSDDVVRNPEKLREHVAKMHAEKLDAIFMQYEYEYDEARNCIVRQIRERVIRRSDFVSGKVRWAQPIHEHLVGLKKGGLFEDVVIEHHTTILAENVFESGNLRVQSPQRDHVRLRNLKNLIIEAEAFKAAQKDIPPRSLFYLGVELRAVNVDLAIEYLSKYIPVTTWDEERSQARLFIGQIREMQLRGEEAWDHFAGAALDFPSNPSPWFGLARIAFVRGQWLKVIEYTEKGFAQVGDDVARKPALTLNPLEWRYRAHLPYSRALIEVGRIEEALASAEKGLQVEPDCKFLREHVAMARERLGKEAA